jgi:hypothetical protein
MATGAWLRHAAEAPATDRLTKKEPADGPVIHPFCPIDLAVRACGTESGRVVLGRDPVLRGTMVVSWLDVVVAGAAGRGRG